MEGLTLQYLGHPMQSQLIGKDPEAENDWGQEEKGMTRWDGWMTSLTQWTWVWAVVRTGKPGTLQSMGSQRVRHNIATEQQQWEHCEIWVILGALWCCPRTLCLSFPTLVPECVSSSVLRSGPPPAFWLQIGCWSSRLHLQRRRKKSDLLHGFKNQKTLPQSTLQTVVSSELSGCSCSTCSYLNQFPGGALGLHDWLAP